MTGVEVTSRDGDNPGRRYNLYRVVAEYTALDQAGVELVNNQRITRTSYTDLVIIDGDYVYAVTAVNEVGSESAPSTNANAKADSSGPKIIELSYEPLRSEEHTSELQSRGHLVCRLLLEKKKKTTKNR